MSGLPGQTPLHARGVLGRGDYLNQEKVLIRYNAWATDMQTAAG